ncbi:MAG: NAD(P)/FAD-dependent oxidoreductase, partial [Sphingobacterium sp.]
MIKTDICIIGAGPVGLFAVFEAGLLKMRCHLIDVLPQIGGQLSEIYPHKPIYDIPGYPTITAQQLINNQLEQINPFNPTFTLGERVNELQKQADNSFIVCGSFGTKIHCKVIVIAGGLGCFEPRKPEVINLTDFEAQNVHYMIRDPEKFRDQQIVIAGGGDSALDWTIYLSEIAKEITLVHRSDTFRGAPDSVEKVFNLARTGKLNLLLSHKLVQLAGNKKLEKIQLTNQNKEELWVNTDHFIPLYGLSPKLGPIANWDLIIDKNAIEVNTTDYSTNIERIYAIG